MDALNHPPFDVAEIDEKNDPLSALVAERSRRTIAPKAARIFPPGVSYSPRPPEEHNPEVAADGEAGPAPTPQAGDGIELSTLSIFIRNSDKRSMFSFIELEGYPILRVTVGDQTHDLILNNDQVKLLLRQMTLWLTR